MNLGINELEGIQLVSKQDRRRIWPDKPFGKCILNVSEPEARTVMLTRWVVLPQYPVEIRLSR